MADESALKHNSPWLFGILGIPTGLANAIIVALMPYVLRKQGVAVDRIVATGNFPILYMTWLDGVGYKHGAVRGLMTVDALANGIGALVLLLVARSAMRYFRESQEAESAIAAP